MGWHNTIIDHCEFPDSLLYDYDGNTWVQVDNAGSEVTVGITSLLAGIAGKFSSVKPKPPGTLVRRGMSLGTLESGRMVGPIPSPLTGIIVGANQLVASNPAVINASPYSEGWIVRLRPDKLQSEKKELSDIATIASVLKQKVAEYHVRCFKLFPDHEMVEVGVECGAALARLNEFIRTLPIGSTIHIVSDDPTAYVEMVAWSDRTGQELVEDRREDDLYHFIVRKRVV